MNRQSPPPLPWVQQTAEYKSSNLRVVLCEDSQGRVWSYHDFLSPEDKEISQTMRYGGIQQIAYALLTEALRREVFATTLILASQDSAFLSRWKQGDQDVEETIKKSSLANLTATLPKMIGGVVKEILELWSPIEERKV